MLRLAGQVLLGGGVGALLGGASGAIAGVPSWVDHRITNGQSLLPETEEDSQQLGGTVGGYGEVGAWVGTGLGALAGLSVDRMAGSDAAIDAIGQAGVPLTPSPGPTLGGGGGRSVDIAGDELGAQVMRVMGRGLEDGRVGVNVLRTVGMHEEAARKVAEALAQLSPAEAGRLREAGMGIETGGDVAGQGLDRRIFNALYDRDSFRAAIDVLHARPEGHAVNYVGNDASFNDYVFQPRVEDHAREALSQIFHAESSSTEDRLAAAVGIGALAKAGGLGTPENRLQFYQAIGDEDKMLAYGEKLRRDTRELGLGFDYDDWQPPAWIAGYDAAAEQQRWLDSVRRRR
jgi:hypothetical protein